MKLTNKQLKQIIAEELRSILKEGVYVKPGWEPEEDEYEKEIQQMFADDPDLLKKFKELTAGTDDELAASMGQANYPEIDPEAEEAKFGVMGGAFSDVAWGDLVSEMPFDDGLFHDNRSWSDLKKWIQNAMRHVKKYPADMYFAYPDNESKPLDLQVKNLAARSHDEANIAGQIERETRRFIDKTYRTKINSLAGVMDMVKKQGMDSNGEITRFYLKQMEEFKQMKRKLSIISDWSQMQKDMYINYHVQYRKHYNKEPRQTKGYNSRWGTANWGPHRKGTSLTEKIVREELRSVLREIKNETNK